MSSSIGLRVRAVRESTGLSRPKFSELAQIPKETLATTENGRYEPKAGILESICNTFPQYTLWLMTEKTDPKGGQVSPLDSNRYGWRVRLIRESEGLSQQEFSERVQLDTKILSKIETETTKLDFDVFQSICMAFPQYTLWLMTGTIRGEREQVIPVASNLDSEN